MVIIMNNLNEKKVLDTFEKFGMWKLPSLEEHVSGILKYDKGSITLKIMYQNNLQYSINSITQLYGQTNENPEVISGFLESGEYVFLLGHMKGHSDPCKNNIGSKIYNITKIYCGDMQPKVNMKYNKISFSYMSLFNWLHPNSIKSDLEALKKQGDFSKWSFDYLVPKNKKIQLQNGDFLEIYYGYSISDESDKNFTISQSASVGLKTNDLFTFEQLYLKMLPFYNFLILAIDHPTQDESVKIFHDDEEFTVFITTKYYEDMKEQETDLMHFNYGQIESNFEEIMKQWFVYYEKYEQALELYFNAKLDEPYLPIKLTFLGIVQSLDALYIIKYGDGKELFKKRLEKLAEEIDVFNIQYEPLFFENVTDTRHSFSHGHLPNKTVLDKKRAYKSYL